jgi:integrase
VPFVSKADVDRLVAAATNPRFGAYLRVLADTGIRRSEGAGLEWRDVHLARRRIVIRPGRDPDAGADLVWPEFAEKRADAPSAWFHTVAKRAGLRLRLHDLRHGYCSRLAQAGIALPTIMALAGHTSWQTTQRYATHLPEGATRAAIDKLERHERRHSSKSQQGKQAETK